MSVFFSGHAMENLWDASEMVTRTSVTGFESCWTVTNRVWTYLKLASVSVTAVPELSGMRATVPRDLSTTSKIALFVGIEAGSNTGIGPFVVAAAGSGAGAEL